jgi:hypothetical protein
VKIICLLIKYASGMGDDVFINVESSLFAMTTDGRIICFGFEVSTRTWKCLPILKHRPSLLKERRHTFLRIFGKGARRHYLNRIGVCLSLV